MTITSFAGASLPNRLGASRTTLATPTGTAASSSRKGVAADSLTRATFGASAGDVAVYTSPRAASGPGHLWSSPANQGDAISTLMARNRGLGVYSLADQWRGLGGALLARLAETGEGYTQARVDDWDIAVDGETDALSAEARVQQAAKLDGVTSRAVVVGLKIQTRSGQSVELTISVNSGYGGIVGTKVELQASGAMGAEERAAIEQLGDGLNRALDGLGQPDAVSLDLSGLTGYDRGAIAGVDLTVSAPEAGFALEDFSLHLGDSRRSVALKGSDGAMHLDVDAALPAGASAPRGAAMQRLLERMDGAGERGRANAALVEQMKSAFEQLQAAAVQDKGESRADGGADLASQASGLADFDAGLEGATWRSNRFGTTHEAGQVDYRLSQKTATNAASHGGRSLVQAVSEQLSADYRTASRSDGMLDVRTGNYSATRVRDSSTVATLVEAAANGVVRALRKTDEHRLKTVTEFESHRAGSPRSWPLQRSVVERLR
jgi:hypothetical protein